VSQAQVLQVVILRDGLLLGTEVFMPGQHAVGSGAQAELKLDDATVSKHHATLYFQSGRSAIQAAAPECLVFVNGHKIASCEVRAVDEIIIGPFTLKVRVVSQQKNVAAPPAEIRAILEPSLSSKQVTVVSARRTANALRASENSPTAEIPAVIDYNRFGDDEESTRTESVAIPSAHATAGESNVNKFAAVTVPGGAIPTGPAMAAIRPPPPPPPSAPTPKRRKEIENIKSMESDVDATNPGEAHVFAPPPSVPKPLPNQVPKQSQIAPPINQKKLSKAKLFVDLFWGVEKQNSYSFGNLGTTKLSAQKNSKNDFALLGFQLPADFVFAEQDGDVFRVFVPPDCTVERQANDTLFYPIPDESLESSKGSVRCIALGRGHAVRFSNALNHAVVASVSEPLPAAKVGLLSGLPWLFLTTMTLCVGAFATFAIAFSDPPEKSDFDARSINPISVKLIAPPKPEQKKKLLEKVEKLKRLEKKKEVAEKPKTAPTQDTKRALKAVEKITANPAMKQLLAAVDKMGAGLGSLKVKNDAKLSGLLGKDPVANTGLGTIGLGGGGGSTKGSELLKGGGIGALGIGTVGKGSVGGTVTKAVSRNIGAQGSIDKEAVAKVINSHLHEVSACYEKALLKTPGLSGKIVLEWQITTSGTVGFAKTKSSSMQSPAVEACILQTLKMWKFPAAQGAGVVITYPFMFNSVGY
jgi:hypothetical protein